MSRYHALRARPPKWVSAHRTNEFTFGLPTQMAFGGYDASGYLGIVMTSTWGSYVPVVGDRLFVYSGNYLGYHVIREVVSSIQFVTETTYTTAMYNENVAYVTLPTISIYKGYSVGELILPLYPSGSLDLFTVQPRTLVAEFKPESGIDGLITFDVSGYLKSAMEVPTPNSGIPKSQSETYLIENYKKVELLCDGSIELIMWVANSARTTQELNRFFVDTQHPMQPLAKPELFTRKLNILDYITQITQIRNVS